LFIVGYYNLLKKSRAKDKNKKVWLHTSGSSLQKHIGQLKGTDCQLSVNET
jgi:hypothetical protein